MTPAPCRRCLELAAYAREAEATGLRLSGDQKSDEGRRAVRLGVALQMLQELALRLEAHAREHAAHPIADPRPLAPRRSEGRRRGRANRRP